MLGKSKHFTLITVELPRQRETETLSPPSDADAPNQVKVANVLPHVQKCTYMVMTGCESKTSVPKMHSVNSSQKCTHTVRSGCKSRTSVPKIHPKNIFGSSSQNQLIKVSTNYWPNDLLGTISLILNVQCPQPSKPEFKFLLTKQLAAKNFCIMNKYNKDLRKSRAAQFNSPLGYGSDFCPTDTLEVLFSRHPN